jgi:hypothetical protein
MYLNYLKEWHAYLLKKSNNNPILALNTPAYFLSTYTSRKRYNLRLTHNYKVYIKSFYNTLTDVKNEVA